MVSVLTTPRSVGKVIFRPEKRSRSQRYDVQSYSKKLSFPHAKRGTRIKRQALYDLTHMTKVFKAILVIAWGVFFAK